MGVHAASAIYSLARQEACTWPHSQLYLKKANSRDGAVWRIGRRQYLTGCIHLTDSVEQQESEAWKTWLRHA
jgi:hypothetical protein